MQVAQVQTVKVFQNGKETTDVVNRKLPLHPFRLCLYRNNNITVTTAIITLLFLECWEYKTVLQVNHDWAMSECNVCPWYVLLWFWASQDDASFSPQGCLPFTKCPHSKVQRRNGCERMAQHFCTSSISPATLCGLETYPAFSQRLLHPEQRSERTAKPATDLCYGYKLLAALCQPPALGSCLCNLCSSAGPACKQRSHTASNAWICSELIPPLTIFNQLLLSPLVPMSFSTCWKPKIWLPNAVKCIFGKSVNEEKAV